MKLSTPITFTLVALLGGCSTGQHMYTSDGKCITCWNNPISGEAINHEGQQSAEDQSTTSHKVETAKKNQPKEHSITFSVPVNVDVAYLKIKKELNYYTDREIRQEWGSMADAKMQTFAYAYDATPSVHYHMRADRQHNGVQAIIDSKIEKSSERMSTITITYWLRDNNEDAEQFSSSLKNRISKALNLPS